MFLNVSANKAFIFLLGFSLSLRMVGLSKVIFFQSGCFSLMQFFRSSISFKISDPDLHGAPFVPICKMI